MKPIRHYLTLAAILIALPAVADDNSQPPIPPCDPELMLLRIDLKVLLQRYEQLCTERSEAELQFALAEAEALKLESAKAKKSLEEKQADKPATKEEVSMAQNKDEARKWELEKLTTRVNVLDRIEADTREQVRNLAKQLTARMQESSHKE